MGPDWTVSTIPPAHPRWNLTTIEPDWLPTAKARGTGTAYHATVANRVLSMTAILASGTGTAYPITYLVSSGTVNAPAGHAAGSGSASGAMVP